MALRQVVRGTLPAKILGVLLCAALITLAWATVDRLTLALGIVVGGSLILLGSGQYAQTREASNETTTTHGPSILARSGHQLPLRAGRATDALRPARRV